MSDEDRRREERRSRAGDPSRRRQVELTRLASALGEVLRESGPMAEGLDRVLPVTILRAAGSLSTPVVTALYLAKAVARGAEGPGPYFLRD